MVTPMADNVDKVIVTNLSALAAKYGAGLSHIRRAVQKLISADKARGLKTILVPLDEGTGKKKGRRKKVAKAADPKENKEAIDAVFKAYTPDYVLILGSIDVVPHQDLVNPAYSPGADDDQYAFGDLPYACEAPYSQKPEDFTGPTRVVGRLPDVTGGKDPGYLIGLLETAAHYRTLSFADYVSYLGISADVWKGSTQASLQNAFGSAADLQLAPPEGPNWAAALLGRRSHFINCHGAPADPKYYGQKGFDYPVSHLATWITGRVTEGTVVAAECCYGAELYDPALARGQQGICNTYLAGKAYGFFGSSTIAYGPADGNDSADLLCRFFMEQVLAGASTGRAALQARQNFAAHAMLGPVNLKTLAQFSLMGDPAVHAVQAAHGGQAVVTARTSKAVPPGGPGPEAARDLRRSNLMRLGLALAAAVSFIRTNTKKSPTARVKNMLTKEAGRLGVLGVRLASFAVHDPKVVGSMKNLMAGQGASAVHLAVGRLPGHERAPCPQLLAIVAAEKDGQFLVKHLYSR
jgi:hypothetical protein